MRVLIVDDHALVRAGITSLLKASGLEVVGEAADGAEGIARARELKPDLVLMDIAMRGCSGIDAARAIKSELPEIKVVMLTVSDDENDLYAAIKSGADGYLLKDLHEAEFAEVLKRVAADEPILSPPLARKLLHEFARLRQESDEGLTNREKEVLALVAQGGTNKEIAAELFLSVSTVDFHLRNILAKLHLRNRAQAAVWATEHGFTAT